MRKRCKRTVRDPMAAIERRLPLRQDQTTDLGIAYRSSLEALLSGNGTEQAWSTVTCALNIALVLSENGHAAESADIFRRALDAMVRAQERAQRIGKWGFDGEGQHVVRAAFDALAIGKDERPTPSGQMVQCYVALCYLLYQRTTEIRLLKWSQIQADKIHFKPTKTEATSGANVAVPITPAIREWLEKARSTGTVKGIYVIHTKHGQPYTTNGIRTAWNRATERAGVEGRTLKDLRAKALTDAKKAGYEMKQLAVAAAHTDEAMTETYIKRREVPVSEVQMAMPKRCS